MSTAKNETGHGAAWANLIVCGGISWAVSLWHAFHPEQGTDPNTALALLIATAPIVTAAFGSHNIAKRGGGRVRVAMTALVFAMGMALSIKAQAQSVGPFVGGTPLGVVFALMLDLSTFIALSSIMSAPSAAAPTEAPVSAPVSAPVAPPVGAPVTAPAGRLPERLPTASRTPAASPVKAPGGPPADRPKRPRTAPAKKSPKAKRLTPDEARAKAWELLKKNPDMSAPALAVELGKSPTSGHVRDMKAKLLQEMRDSGDLQSVRAVGA